MPAKLLSRLLAQRRILSHLPPRLHIFMVLTFLQQPRTKALLEVSRLDKPVGTLLLLWPTVTALWIAAGGWPGWHLVFVFVFAFL